VQGATEKFFRIQIKWRIIMKRRKYKEDYNKNPNPLLKARSNAFKLIANAAYGYQGFFGARYYSIEAAASTAYFARENNSCIVEWEGVNNANSIYLRDCEVV
jgi:DNA polymerase elongation subunit (family B)